MNEVAGDTPGVGANQLEFLLEESKDSFDLGTLRQQLQVSNSRQSRRFGPSHRSGGHPRILV